jgi:hypothetical protein
MFDKLMVWLAFKIANHNARKWSIDQLQGRILELEYLPNPNKAELMFLTAYRSYWYSDNNYPFGP